MRGQVKPGRRVLKEIQERLRGLGDGKRARVSQSFFKTGPGEYGEGDIFLGIRVPRLRKLAKEYQDIGLKETEALLQSGIHEERQLALFILIGSFLKASRSEQERIYELYIRNTAFINNWDLVDSSAEHIVGAFLMDRSAEPLFTLARSESLWDRRIAVVSTHHFIKRGRFSETLEISKRLLSDKEDLIHKAVGWMLREIGKRDLESEENFLKTYYRSMPRTMLRYAIEKFPESKRQAYLKGTM